MGNRKLVTEFFTIMIHNEGKKFIYIKNMYCENILFFTGTNTIHTFRFLHCDALFKFFLML